MITTGLTISLLGMMLALTGCATTDSNGFVNNTPKDNYRYTDHTFLASDDAAVEADAIQQMKEIEGVNVAVAKDRHEIDTNVHHTIETELNLLPVDNSEEW